MARLRLARGELERDGVAVVAVGLALESARLVDGPALDRDSAVHKTRKNIKRLRTLLRLIRPALSPDYYRSENLALRDSSRALAQLRDAAVALETMELVRPEPDTPLESAWLALREESAQSLVATWEIAVLQGSLAGAARELRKVGDRAAVWGRCAMDVDPVFSGLRRLYRNAWKLRKVAVADPTVEPLHEWRKAVKYLYYALQAIRDLAPEVEARLRVLDELGELLGREHDLTALLQILHTRDGGSQDPAGSSPARSNPTGSSPEGSILRLASIVDGLRAEVCANAFLLGAGAFQHTPKEFRARLEDSLRTERG